MYHYWGCTKCGFIYLTRYDMKRHWEREHDYTPRMPRLLYYPFRR